MESPLNLLARFPVARVALDDASRGEIPIDSAEHFAGGWYQANHTTEGRLYRWLGPRAGVIDVGLTAPADLAIVVDLVAPRDDRVPPIRVRFLWNGHYLGVTELRDRAQSIRMSVPLGATRAGMNRLEVLPSFWINGSMLSDGSSSASVSVNLYHLTIARSGAPTNLAGPLPSLNADGSVWQSANTVVSYFTRVGPAATLTVAGEWLPNQGASGPTEAVLLIRDNTGRTEEVAFADPAAPEAAFSKNINLSGYAGGFVEISTVVRCAGANHPRPNAVVWKNLSLANADETRRPAAKPAAGRKRPNIVLVVFDTLRADYTEPYGATTVKTPNITRLASNSLLFANAFAPTSWTRPSVATMFSGLHETRHGTVTIEHTLSGSVPYLPEILRDAGYKTACITTNGHITAHWGFDRGFESFHDLNASREQILSAHPTPEGYVNAIWDKCVPPAFFDSDSPAFLYFHEIDPHDPYTPRPPFDTMYSTSYGGHTEIEADNVNLVRLGLTELAPQDIADLESRYRGEVAFVDAVLGAIVDRLERDGLADNTLLIVTADHGEEFGEHGGIGHMATLYNEMLRVPLICSWPGQLRNGREDSSIGLIDFSPTLLGLLGIAAPDTMEGRDLSPMLFADGPAIEYPILGLLTRIPDRVRRAVNWGGWKLYEQDFGAESAYELYDTVRNPREITNLWTAQREAGGALRQVLEWYLYQTSAAGRASPEKIPLETLDPEMAERLKSLGYVR